MDTMALSSGSLAFFLAQLLLPHGYAYTRCPPGLSRGAKLKTFRNHCYEFVDYETDWHEANDICGRLSGHLVEIRDRATQNFIMRSLDSLRWSRNGLWIGLHDQMSESYWQWVTGDHLTWSNWEGGQHGCCFGAVEDCAVFRYSGGGKWHDYPCSGFLYRYSFICQYDMITTTTTTAATTTATTTTTASPVTSEKKTTSLFPLTDTSPTMATDGRHGLSTSGPQQQVKGSTTGQPAELSTKWPEVPPSTGKHLSTPNKLGTFNFLPFRKDSPKSAKREDVDMVSVSPNRLHQMEPMIQRGLVIGIVAALTFVVMTGLFFGLWFICRRRNYYGYFGKPKVTGKSVVWSKVRCDSINSGESGIVVTGSVIDDVGSHYDSCDVIYEEIDPKRVRLPDVKDPPPKKGEPNVYVNREDRKRRSSCPMSVFPFETMDCQNVLYHQA